MVNETNFKAGFIFDKIIRNDTTGVTHEWE